MNYKKQQIFGFGFLLFLSISLLVIEGLIFQYTSISGIWGVTGILMLLLIASGTFIAGWTIRRTTSRLQLATDVINNTDFNQAERLPRLEVDGGDEIANIAEAYNRMSLALELHNRKVREASEHLEDNNWVQTQFALTGNIYQGINNKSELAEKMMARLVPLLEAAYGLLYYKEANEQGEYFKLDCAYSAYTDMPDAISVFASGEGIIGRVASTQQTIILNDNAEHPIRIQTGQVALTPRQIVVIPIVFENAIVAVLELGSLTTFSQRQLKLMDLVCVNLGVVIDNIENRMQVNQLLQNSQQLNMELQAQQEELQVQQEELQVQQEELQATNEQLRERNQFAESKTHELETTQQELQEYAKRLEQSSGYKSQFLANMSHELRTPINSILILSQLIAEHEPVNEDDEIPKYGGIIHRSGEDLLALIDDILDLSKVEAGMVDVHHELVSVQEIPELLNYSFGKLAEQRGIQFNYMINPEVPHTIYTDGKRVQQILKNLLSNAFKFTPSGSITLKVEPASNVIPAYGYSIPDQIEDMIAISVIDTGVGIARDRQQPIFEAFQQERGSVTERNYGGTGLGLSICREFSRLLGGFVTVESEQGKGSTFTLYLPAGQSEENTALVSHYDSGPIDITADMQILQGRKVLLVDDDPRNITALESALKVKGLQVFSAPDGNRALHMIEQIEPDLIVMDMMMPVMDGYEALRRIRLNPEWQQLPIIALTAKAMKDDRERCLQAGASDYLSKPINMTQLLSAMQVWLTRVQDDNKIPVWQEENR
ncbi:response regulator [Paenibacillus sp. WLX1005]|uniref:hybrid sensor histidine kinase/response regulator n=1 Tax=Paenibacillus sp. WLX1005 TaxID=3243766 RepID=UPI003983EE93